MGFGRIWEARGVPRKPGSLGRPADHFVGGRFPDGRLRASAPAGAAEMAHVARALRGRLEELELPIAVLAQNCGVDRTTIHDLLAGRSFIDVVTLARIETAVGARLWPCDIER